MRILIVSQYFYPETFRINDLASELVSRGHQVTVYCGLPNYLLGKFFPGYSFLGPYRETYNGVKIIRSPLIPRGKKIGPKLILNYLSFAILGSLFAPFLVRGKFDKIFVYGLSPITLALPAIFLNKFKKVPMLMWVTDLWPESLSATGVIKNKNLLGFLGKGVSWIYSKMDKIYISSMGFQGAIKKLGVPEKKIEYWPYWAESLFDNPEIPSKYERLPIDGFKVMFAGNIGEAQDVETVLEAVRLLKNEENIKFIFVGDGLRKGWLENEVKRLGLESKVVFTGRKPLETMPSFYYQSDVLLLTLKPEPIFSITVPSKLQSYLASKKPIICGVDGEASNIVESWQSGFTAKAGNATDLASKILKMSKMNPEEIKRFGENSYNCYKKNFNREVLISKLETEMETLNFFND